VCLYPIYPIRNIHRREAPWAWDIQKTKLPLYLLLNVADACALKCSIR